MLLVLFAILLILIFLGAPVLLALGGVALAGVLMNPELSPAEFPKRMFTFLDSFSLLALPYFILAGELMSRGGMSKKLVEFGETVVGHLRGGLAQAGIVACMIFGNVSGSAAAATAAIGSILAPSMKERGYKPGFSAALMGCAGIIGSIIPPSMIMIVYGSMANVSIGGLFLAGILPGLLITALMMVTVYLHSFHKDFPELRQTSGKFRLKPVLEATVNVWTAILAPVIVLGGILTGKFTATEAGVVACIYSFLVSYFVYRSIKLRDLPRMLVSAAITTTIVVGIISVAGAFGYVMTYLKFDESVKSMLFGISGNKWVVLICLLMVMLFLTMFIESLAVLIILVPIIIDISHKFGFDAYYFGMLIVMATQIGATTPPVAVVLFVGTSVFNTTYDQTVKYCLPFVGTLILVLIIIILCPPLSTWIPEMFLKAGGG